MQQKWFSSVLKLKHIICVMGIVLSYIYSSIYLFTSVNKIESLLCAGHCLCLPQQQQQKFFIIDF